MAAALHQCVKRSFGEVLGLDGDRGQKVCERPALGRGKATLHILRGQSAKQRRIPLAEDAAKTLAVDAALVQYARQLLLRQRQFLACL